MFAAFQRFHHRSRGPWAPRRVDFRESLERYVLDKSGLRVSLAYKEHLSWLERVMRHEVVDEVG